MKVAKDFILPEFVPRSIHYRYGDKSIWFLDPAVFDIAQFLKDRFKKIIIINNWIWGGTYNESGYRTPNTSTGATYSQHKFGRAIDVKIQDVTPAELRDDIIKHYNLYRKKGVTTIEEGTPTWTHIDCRNTGSDDLLIVPFR